MEGLIQAGKGFDLMMYPMRKHGIADAPARIHLFRPLLVLARKVPAAQRPRREHDQQHDGP